MVVEILVLRLFSPAKTSVDLPWEEVSFGFGPDVVELLLLDEVDDEINIMQCGVLVVVIVVGTRRTIIRW